MGGRQGSGGLEECCGGLHPQEGDLKNWISLLDVVENLELCRRGCSKLQSKSCQNLRVVSERVMDVLI